MNLLLLAALPTLQALLDRALRADAGAHRRLRAIGNNRLLHIACTGPLGWQIYLYSDLQGEFPRLRLQSSSSDTPECSISGSPMALMGLLLGDARQQLHQADITLSGDSELAAAMQGLLTGLDVDWEDRLASLFGDLPGHHLNRGLQATKAQLSHSRQRVSHTLRDYLQEESGLLPHPEQLGALRRQMLDARLHLDRLEARLALLRSRMPAALTESERTATN